MSLHCRDNSFCLTQHHDFLVELPTFEQLLDGYERGICPSSLMPGVCTRTPLAGFDRELQLERTAGVLLAAEFKQRVGEPAPVGP